MSKHIDKAIGSTERFMRLMNERQESITKLVTITGSLYGVDNTDWYIDLVTKRADMILHKFCGLEVED